MEVARGTFRLILSVLAKLCQAGVISRTASGFVKELFLSGDVRLLHAAAKYQDGREDLRQFFEHLHDLIATKSSKLLQGVYASVTLQHAKSLSQNERRTNHDLDISTSLTYGEIDWLSFYKILRRLGPCSGQRFYDLGSGTGRAVLQARTVCDFNECHGIEILGSLHSAALSVIPRYAHACKTNNIYPWGSSASSSGSGNGSTDDSDGSNCGIHLKVGSIAGGGGGGEGEGHCPWADGDVIFANSTCFTESLMEEISREGEKLKPGSVFITFTKPLSNVPSKFELLDKVRMKMSWGPATVFIQRRLGLDDKPVGPSPLDNWKKAAIFQKNDECRPLIALTSLTGAVLGANLTGLGLGWRTKLLRCVHHGHPGSAAPPSSSSSSSSSSSASSSSSSSSSSPSSSSSFSLPLAPPPAPSLTSQIKYIFRFPAEVGEVTKANSSATAKVRQALVPLVVFLHGASARGTSFENHENMGLLRVINELEEQGTIPRQDRFCLLAPLCPPGIEWKTGEMANAVLRLIDAICMCSASWQHMRIDSSRVYLTGISMGGLGTWMLAARAPKHTFAAISPMCGGGSPVYAKLISMPIWLFHSKEDNVIGEEETAALFRALQAEGGRRKEDTRYTRYDNSPDPAAQDWMVGHNCWDRTYRTADWWKWLLAQRSERRE